MSSPNEPLKSEPPTVQKSQRRSRERDAFAVLRRRGPGRQRLILLFLVVVGAVGVSGWVTTRPEPAALPVVPYSEVASALAAGGVEELTLEDGGNRIIARLKAPYRAAETRSRLVVTSVPASALSVADLERWAANGAKVRMGEKSRAPSADTVIQVISLLALLSLVAFVAFRQRGGSSRRFTATPPSRQLTMADVGGVAEAQAELRDVIAYLRDPERFRAMGAKCPKGVLLVGPPGTGKTLLARAVAGEAGCPVIMAAGSDFNEVYVGVGSRRIRQLAAQAREQAPCIVFIDEFDSLGGRRGRPNRSGEEEVTLNQLLVEMDGMQGSEGVVWMAATNREDMLDPAVRRPGRFDRIVEVQLPTVRDRLEILKIHASRAPLAADVDLERLARLTVGHSGADLANLLNEAAIIAVQEEKVLITANHIEQARDRILLGRVRAGVVVTGDERRLIALHEAGHAVVGLVACPDDKLHKVTIEARGRSLGAAHFAPEADRHLHSRRYLEGVIAKALGGRAAESVFLGPDAVTSGAGSDLVHATNVARRMVGEFGMSEEVGLISADPAAQGGAPSAQLQSQIDAAVRTLITAQAERATAIVSQYRDAVEAIAQALLEREVISSEEVYELAARFGIERAVAA
ncbi:MAG TPA: AAA family ATPase [Gemmatimonadaceae bacterium]|nr:AAA family ATPase [Gemmatimonadaceae bacterium]